MDLHNGYMAVGGLTSVGRGMFEIIAVNGDNFSGDWDIEKMKGVVFGDK